MLLGDFLRTFADAAPDGDSSTCTASQQWRRRRRQWPVREEEKKSISVGLRPMVEWGVFIVFFFSFTTLSWLYFCRHVVAIGELRLNGSCSSAPWYVLVRVAPKRHPKHLVVFCALTVQCWKSNDGARPASPYRLPRPEMAGHWLSIAK